MTQHEAGDLKDAYETGSCRLEIFEHDLRSLPGLYRRAQAVKHHVPAELANPEQALISKYLRYASLKGKDGNDPTIAEASNRRINEVFQHSYTLLRSKAREAVGNFINSYISTILQAVNHELEDNPLCLLKLEGTIRRAIDATGAEGVDPDQLEALVERIAIMAEGQGIDLPGGPQF